MIWTGSVARIKQVENKYNFNSQERRRYGRQRAEVGDNIKNICII